MTALTILSVVLLILLLISVARIEDLQHKLAVKEREYNDLLKKSEGFEDPLLRYTRAKLKLNAPI